MGSVHQLWTSGKRVCEDDEPFAEAAGLSRSRNLARDREDATGAADT
jgi:hypothetical protein